MSLILSFTLALLLTAALMPLCVRYAGMLGLIDSSTQRKVHTGLMPRSGGIAIVLGATGAALFWMPLTREHLLLFAALGVIVTFAFLDDLLDLDATWKLKGQVLASFVFVATCGGFTFLPFMGLDPAPLWLSLPLTVLFLTGITNAVNLSDGLDGLAAGNSLLSLILLALLAGQTGDTSYDVVALAIAGGLLGFLRFNTHPARIFMGDTGSQFLGFRRRRAGGAHHPQRAPAHQPRAAAAHLRAADPRHRVGDDRALAERPPDHGRRPQPPAPSVPEARLPPLRGGDHPLRPAGDRRGSRLAAAPRIRSHRGRRLRRVLRRRARLHDRRAGSIGWQAHARTTASPSAATSGCAACEWYYRHSDQVIAGALGAFFLINAMMLTPPAEIAHTGILAAGGLAVLWAFFRNQSEFVTRVIFFSVTAFLIYGFLTNASDRPVFNARRRRLSGRAHAGAGARHPDDTEETAFISTARTIWYC